MLSVKLHVYVRLEVEWNKKATGLGLFRPCFPYLFFARGRARFRPEYFPWSETKFAVLKYFSCFRHILVLADFHKSLHCTQQVSPYLQEANGAANGAAYGHSSNSNISVLP